MVNHLKPDLMEIEVKVDERMMAALIGSGRLQFHQRADDLAVKKAIARLIDDLVEGKKFWP